METFMHVLDQINGILWHEIVLYVLLGVGVLFTIWSKFGQWRALTHGVAVIRGKYDEKGDPGAINHFQALSAALSATVGLGNIAGVAIAVSIGGPGAVFWMWVVGLVGMALKMTEVTQAMLYRNTDDPENPHGGAMWVCVRGFPDISRVLTPFAWIVGSIFCLTLLVSAVTGGNMFQAWNVADISFEYFGMPQIVSGIIMTIVVGLVIVGGIKRIGSVAGRLVPFMCILYVLAGLYVVVTNLDRIPEMFALIFREAFAPSEAVGAFIGGTAGFGFLKGMQRALFSNEAGQGSAPIAHSAAKTNEPVREGVVAGLEPFVDTLCVCTITALVILLSGAWNRDPALAFVDGPPAVAPLSPAAAGASEWRFESARVKVDTERDDQAEAEGQLREGKEVFLVVDAGKNSETGMSRHRVAGVLRRNDGGEWFAEFDKFTSETEPQIAVEGVYLGFKGATLTAKAYDRVLPGLGYWVVPATAWLFAISTIISWSYYGEQGIVFLFGLRWVMTYRIIYCLLILVATAGWIRTETQLDIVSTLGTGVMLWANIPIMLLFGRRAMREFHEYMRRLDAGEFRGHGYPKLTDVVEGKDVE